MALPRGDRSGVTTGDALVVLSLLALAFSVVYPRIESAVEQQEIDAAVADIETIRGAALAFRDSSGSWPAEAPAGTVPAELVPSLPGDFALDWEHYTLDWNLWETVREPPPDSTEDVLGSVNPVVGALPPELPMEVEVEGPSLSPLPGISLHTQDEKLLAALLERYGSDRSFVHGSVWTLVLGGGD